MTQIFPTKTQSGRRISQSVQYLLTAGLLLLIVFVQQHSEFWLNKQTTFTSSYKQLLIDSIHHTHDANLSISDAVNGHAPHINHNHLAEYKRNLPPQQLSGLQCMALNIYFEARGESEKGQRAVGHVVLNRAAHHKFPETICDVIRQGGEFPRHRCQFSWWCDGRSDTPRNRKSWEHALRIAKEVMGGNSVDPTNGALWYHAHYVNPYWRKAFLQGPTIGQHIFYRAQTRNS